jgi:RNA polymerase sigma factor (sigma-70 family)
VTPEEAFNRHHQAVFSFTYRLTRSEDIAEDITQECFLALLRAPQRFDPARGNIRAYLLSIARNLALKQYRDGRAEEALDAVDVPATAAPQQALEASSAVAAAVAELPHLQQEALILFEYEGMTLEEIAQIVATEVGTVKSRLHRARERLRCALAPYRKVGSAHGTV